MQRLSEEEEVDEGGTEIGGEGAEAGRPMKGERGRERERSQEGRVPKGRCADGTANACLHS